jgi:hypothetical protein
MHRKVKSLDGADRAFPGTPLSDLAGNFHKTEAPALQHY